jgi:hypothetical protein
MLLLIRKYTKFQPTVNKYINLGIYTVKSQGRISCHINLLTINCKVYGSDVLSFRARSVRGKEGLYKHNTLPHS